MSALRWPLYHGPVNFLSQVVVTNSMFGKMHMHPPPALCTLSLLGSALRWPFFLIRPPTSKRVAAAVVPVWAAAPVSAAVLVLAVVLAVAPEVLAHPLALPRLQPVKGCGRSPRSLREGG